MLEKVRQGLEKSLPEILVSELLESYTEVKNNFYLGKYRPNEVEGGRFSEAVFRVLEYRVKGKYTPLGKQLSTDKLIVELQNTSFGQKGGITSALLQL